MNVFIKNPVLSLLFCIPSVAVAQSENIDTVPSRGLQEVVVSAPTVLRKSDMDLYIPSSSAKALSKNGMQLLQNLKIPSLTVNEVLGSVSSLGNAVQIRINGRVASVDQMKALSPDDIKRVEWIENPGLRYKDASAVINIVVRNPDLGGSFMVQAMPALTTAWGKGNTSVRLNDGRSQWGLDITGQLTDIDIHRDYFETFTYPDGSRLTRDERPRGGKMKHNNAAATFSYSYIKPDTTVIFASISGLRNFSQVEEYTGLLSLSNGSPNVNVRDKDARNGLTPTVSLYVEHHLAKNRILAIDAGTSYYRGLTTHDHLENLDGTGALITDVNTRIRDHNTSYAISADYTEQWRSSRLTAGLSYNGSSNRSTYLNLGGEKYHQTQNQVYFYGEYMKIIGKVTLTAGLGAQYSAFRLRESGLGNNSWNLRPRFSFAYRPGNVSRWSLSFYSWQVSPSLFETNSVAQQIDAFQWQIGNPDLKTCNNYRIDAKYSYTGKRISGDIGVNYQFAPRSIAPFYSWHDDGRLVTSFENSRGRRWFSVYIAPTVTVLPGWLNVTGYLRYGLTNTRGTDYDITRYNWSGSVTAMAAHWGFNLMVQYNHNPTTLTGEKEIWGEKVSLLLLAYNWKKWQFGAGFLCPFNKYDTGSRLLNRYNNNEKHTRLDMSAMPILQISYNLQWGHQKRGVSKRVNADTSVEQSRAGRR